MFAPGQVEGGAERLASDMAAAMLAPTTEEGATVAATKPRNLQPERFADALLVATVALALLVRSSADAVARAVSVIDASFGTELSRRGPPILVA